MKSQASIRQLRRIGYATFIITAMLCIWVARLAWLQFVEAFQALPHDSHTLMKQSVIQRERGIVLDDGRGHIVDRRGTPITGLKANALIFFPIQSSKEQKAAVEQIASLLELDAGQLMRQWSMASEPFVLRDNQKKVVSITETKLQTLQQYHWPGVRLLPYTDPYPLKELTPHWVGYTIEASTANTTGAKAERHDHGWRYKMRKGAYGLEQSFNPLLAGIGPVTFVHYQDAGMKPLPGLDVRIRKPGNPYYPLRLVTTADLSLHEPIVTIMKQHHVKKGAVVVLDAATRDVLAMVSVPAYNPERIDPKDHAWNNLALQAAAPGSVFKLVAAAWALESGAYKPQDSFYCSGEYGKYGLSCWKKGGHGTLTLEEAFAQSCNVAFAQISERMTALDMYHYAHKLGWIGSVGQIGSDHLGHRELAQLPNEEGGRIEGPGKKSIEMGEGEKVQSSIGQRDVRITPLAAANAMVTLLQGGVYGEPRLVQRIEDQSGAVISTFSKQANQERRLQARTAHYLRYWMEQVVKRGTGEALRHRAWTLAGKSGTAQAEAYGTKQLHTWFVGYGPVKKPQYAVAVVSLDEENDSQHRATAVFGDVMDMLASYQVKP